MASHWQLLCTHWSSVWHHQRGSWSRRDVNEPVWMFPILQPEIQVKKKAPSTRRTSPLIYQWRSLIRTRSMLSPLIDIIIRSACGQCARQRNNPLMPDKMWVRELSHAQPCSKTVLFLLLSLCYVMPLCVQSVRGVGADGGGCISADSASPLSVFSFRFCLPRRLVKTWSGSPADQAISTNKYTHVHEKLYTLPAIITIIFGTLSASTCSSSEMHQLNYLGKNFYLSGNNWELCTIQAHRQSFLSLLMIGTTCNTTLAYNGDTKCSSLYYNSCKTIWHGKGYYTTPTWSRKDRRTVWASREQRSRN